MNSGSWFAKSIIELAEVSQQIDFARERYSGFEQTWDGLTWLLARQADTIGQRLGDYRIYKVRGRRGKIVIPNIAVLYDISDDSVEIISIKVTDPTTNIEDLSF